MKPAVLETLLPGFNQPEIKQVIAIGALALTTAAAGIAVAQTEPLPPTRIALSAQTTPGLSPEAAGRLHEILRQGELAKRATAQTPAGVYSVALTLAKGDTAAANKILLARNLPPFQPQTVKQLGRQLRLKPSTPAQDEQAITLYNQWRADLDTADLVHLPPASKALRSMYNSLPPTAEQATRQRIVDLFYQEFKQNVVEQPGPDGKPGNRGGRIDVYTGNRPEAWCSDFTSWIYMQAGNPLNGGHQYGRPDWQLPRVHTNINSPELISAQAWFQQNATYFEAGSKKPDRGDIAFMKFPGRSGSLDDDKASWHVMLVLKNLPDGRVVLGGGNTNNAVAIQTYKPDAINLVGFGSLF